MTATRILETLVITHNHGTVTLRDVTITSEERSHRDAYWRRMDGPTYVVRKATGTPVSGGWTSRLFTATAFTLADTTKPMTWELGTHAPWKNEDGTWSVDVSFCG